MNRPHDLETENELLRAAEENPGSALKLDADGTVTPANVSTIMNRPHAPEIG